MKRIHFITLIFCLILVLGVVLSACGEPGVGIAKIEKTATEGLVDTYTITLTNGETSTFTVTNGASANDDADETPIDEYLGFTLLEDNTYEVYARYYDMPARVVIPSEHQGQPVSSISRRAFAGYISNDAPRMTVKEIIISNGVTTIGEEAFARCLALTSLTIPSSVTRIASYTFENCNLSSILYQGTKAQWNSIEKANYWDYGNENYTVHCTDGDIVKE